MSRQLFLSLICCFLTSFVRAADQPAPTPLPGTAALDWTGDLAARMVEGVDRFLLRETAASVERRGPYWKRDLSSPEKYEASVEPNRQRLAHILGLRDARLPFEDLELVETTRRPALVGKGLGYDVLAVRWPAIDRVHGEGLLLAPRGDKPIIADVVAIPDADQTPEMLVGLTPGTPAEAQYARRLAECGCRVVVPLLINRDLQNRNGRALLTSREYLYRPSFELGRHIIGYELQKILATVDWFAREGGDSSPQRQQGRLRPIGVIGWGEGGMLALCAAALDRRINAACVSGYFDSRQDLWQEPLDRNVFGLLEQFGDAATASLIAPRPLIVEACRSPELTLPSQGGGPGRLVTPRLESVRAEVARAEQLSKAKVQLVVSGAGNGPCGSVPALEKLLQALKPGAELRPPGGAPDPQGRLPDPALRHERQLREIDRHTQWLLTESPYVRQEFMKKLDTSAPEKYAATSAAYRDIFRNDVIGRFDCQPLPFNPRTRVAYDKPLWTGYEVVLDVFPDVFAYGILLLPKDLKPGAKRPTVVCQHGLEGRPQDIVAGDHSAYHDFAAKLTERGFITFAPQNPYIGGDRFRTLQRKANPLKKTLFSVIVPQHQQIVDWLATLPGVDAQRIGFYGLSYGGKSAMRIPALVEKYCLSICSADFNEWVWKNASTRAPHSYVWTGEYEIFEFDLGSTFNYAEMAALIAPRPFMVERGHFDGVAPDETVAYEFAKVRHLYNARLGLSNRTEIEWFVGPHTINGQGTYSFLHKHLNWPMR